MAVVRMAGVSLVGPRDEIEAMALRLLEAGDFEPMSPEVMLSGGRLSSRIRACRSGRCDALLEKLERLRGWRGTRPRLRAEGRRTEPPEFPLRRFLLRRFPFRNWRSA